MKLSPSSSTGGGNQIIIFCFLLWEFVHGKKLPTGIVEHHVKLVLRDVSCLALEVDTVVFKLTSLLCRITRIYLCNKVLFLQPTLSRVQAKMSEISSSR